MQELREGSVLQGGKYRIEKMLGQGGFGITYKAVMKGSVMGNLGGMSVDVPVAIKEFFIKELCMRDPESSRVSVPTTGSREQTDKYRQKFVKEARNIASLSHPNIVQVVDIFEENGTVYYVMQFLSGGSLREYLDKSGPLQEDRAVSYALQIADALGYMHRERHLCHYDVKPGNILRENEEKVMLIDFGISKNYDEHGNETSNTPVGLSQGYAPLEQYQNSLHDFSPVSDVYSLGATLYALLTGKQPPEAAIVNEDGLGERPAQISPRIWNAIEAAMQPRRKDRPQSMEAFTALLVGQATQQQEEEGTVLVGAKTTFVESDQETQLVQSAVGRSVSMEEPVSIGEPARFDNSVSDTPPVATPQQPASPQSAVTPRQPEWNKPQSQSQPQSRPQSQPSYEVNYHPRSSTPEEYQENEEHKSGVLKYILIAVVAALVVFGGVMLFKSMGDAVDDKAVEAVPVKGNVTDKEIVVTVRGVEDTIRYTGPVSDGLPQGKGKGFYKIKGSNLTATYEGPYTGGLRDGNNAVYRLSNGDTFKGSWKSDFYDEGTYTLGDGGSYFTGKFKDGTMYDGQWFDKSGKAISKVVNGVEK